MSVVQMRPYEEAGIGDFVEPAGGFRDDRVSLTIEQRRPWAIAGDHAAVSLESLAQTAIRIQHDGSDKRRSPEALRAQDLGKRRLFGGQRRICVVAHAVPRRVQAGEQAAMRGKSQRRHGGRLIEDDAFSREAIDVGRGDIHEAIRGQAIRPGRVGEVMVAVGGGMQAFLAHDADGGAIDALEEIVVIDRVAERM